MSWLGMDKGEEGQLLDTVWSGVELSVDDQNLAALSGLCHAEFGIVQSMPKPASTRLSTLKAPN